MKYNIDDEVNVTDPKHIDSPHNNAFTGTVIDNTHDFYLIEDQEGAFFNIEEDEIENN